MQTISFNTHFSRLPLGFLGLGRMGAIKRSTPLLYSTHLYIHPSSQQKANAAAGLGQQGGLSHTNDFGTQNPRCSCTVAKAALWRLAIVGSCQKRGFSLLNLPAEIGLMAMQLLARV